MTYLRAKLEKEESVEFDEYSCATCSYVVLRPLGFRFSGQCSCGKDLEAQDSIRLKLVRETKGT